MTNSKILSGSVVANEIYENLIPLIKNNGSIKLIIVTTGDQDASKVYVNSKVKKCKDLGITSIVLHYDFLDSSAVQEMLDKMYQFGFPPFIIQLPITGSVSRSTIYNMMWFYLESHDYHPDAKISKCDVDGLISPYNMLYLESPEYIYGKSEPDLISNSNLPCTPLGIMTLLDYYHYFDNVVNKNAVILGRSDLVGKPLERMLMDRDFTVTVCHSKTTPATITDAINNADLVVSAMGNTNILTYDRLQHLEKSLSEKTLIDVSINRDENGKLRGDCDPIILDWFKAYTPVPGGIGPMTVAMLMCNVVKYYQTPTMHDYAGAIPYVYPTKFIPKYMEIYK